MSASRYKTWSSRSSSDSTSGSFKSLKDGEFFPYLTNGAATVNAVGEVVLHVTLPSTPQTLHHLRVVASPTQGTSHVPGMLMGIGSAFTSFPFVGATLRVERLMDDEAKEAETIAQHNVTCATKSRTIRVSEDAAGGAVRVTTKMRKFPACCKPESRLVEVRVSVAGCSQLSLKASGISPSRNDVQLSKEVTWRRGDESLLKEEGSLAEGRQTPADAGRAPAMKCRC